jgi:hydroxymethylpyrimidine/phosphomethylpyrimidine kinase
MITNYTTALTIAGSDSGGGAGIQADLKTMSALGVYGASVITAITAQNTLGVQGVMGVPCDIIARQLESVFSDIPIDAVKIGMVGDVSAIRVIAGALRKWKPRCIVLDPVMVAKSGDPLISPEAVGALIQELLPLATIITPNIPEAEALLAQAAGGKKDGEKIDSPDKMRQAALLLSELCGASVLVKGGHLDGSAVDVLASGGEAHAFTLPRLPAHNTHGTGCTLSSAIASYLARSLPLHEAIRQAKDYVFTAIEEAVPLGHGKGPVHHFHALWL